MIIVRFAAIACFVGTLDYHVAAAEARERLVLVKASGSKPVPDVATCARLSGLPVPGPCSRAPCGSTFNVSSYSRGAWPYWQSRCEIPVKPKEPAR